MKTLFKSALLAATLLTVAPANAVAGRLRATFANIHNGRKPLTALGALIGIGSTGYLAQQAWRTQAKTPSFGDRMYCGSAIAQTTYRAIRSNNDPVVYNAWMEERAKAFTYCQKMMPREEIYNRNIMNASSMATVHYKHAAMYYNYANAYPTENSYLKNTVERAQDSMKTADIYVATAQQLELDLKKEQEPKPDRVRELMAFGLCN